MMLRFNGCMAHMKRKDRIILQREALYKEVWQMPIMQLAKKYGISDVALAKVCRNMEIPLPPRGYWAKHAYGHAVRRAPLRALSEKGRAEIAIDKTAEELFEIARKRKTTGQQKHKERQRIFRLQNELKEWEMSARIRAYLAAMRTPDHKNGADRVDFLAWAERYADHLDPTLDFRIAVLDDA